MVQAANILHSFRRGNRLALRNTSVKEGAGTATSPSSSQRLRIIGEVGAWFATTMHGQKFNAHHAETARIVPDPLGTEQIPAAASEMFEAEWGLKVQKHF